MDTRHHLLLLSIALNFLLISTATLPMVDPGLFVIQGVETCGLGGGYCLLSNSCRVDSDFESDFGEGHCDGLKHAFNPMANFVCCRYHATTTTTGDTTTEDTTSAPVILTDELNSLTVLSSETAASETTESQSTTTTTTTTTENLFTNTKKRVSPLNIAANTNKILTSIQHLLSGGRMRPSVNTQKNGPVGGEAIYNDKSLLNLILLGMNETLRTSTTSN